MATRKRGGDFIRDVAVLVYRSSSNSEFGGWEPNSEVFLAMPPLALLDAMRDGGFRSTDHGQTEEDILDGVWLGSNDNTLVT